MKYFTTLISPPIASTYKFQHFLQGKKSSKKRLSKNFISKIFNAGLRLT